MEKLIWLIDQDYYEGENDELKRAIVDAGMEWMDLTREDYYMSRLGKGVPVGHPAIAFCTLQVGKGLRQQRPDLASAVVCDLDKLKCSWYYPRVGADFLVNGHCVYTTWGDLPNTLPVLKELYGPEMFIRPDKGDKGFSGTVVDTADDAFERWLKKEYEFSNQFMRPEDMVLVSMAMPQAVLGREFRTFAIGGQIVAGSEYKAAGRTKLTADVPAEVMAFAQQVADVLGSQMDDLGYTIDVAQNSLTGKLAVVELNSLSCSGQYGADPSAIVSAVDAEWRKRAADAE